MNISAERVASLHLAHLQKEASVTKGIEDLAKKAILEDVTQKAMSLGKKKTTKASNKGWAWVLKNEGADIAQVIKDASKSKSSLDSKDPLTRLLHMRLSKISDPFEKNRIVGEFSGEYAKKDIEGMADVLGIDKDVVTISLLWYMRDVKVATKEASRGRARSRSRNKGRSRSRNRSLKKTPTRTTPTTDTRTTPTTDTRTTPTNQNSPTPQRSQREKRREEKRKLREELKEEGYGRGEIKDVMLYEKKKDQIRKDFENFSGFAASSLKIASYVTGGPVIEWLINLLPKGEVFAKPAKWAWWAYLVNNHWTVISTVAKWSGVAYNWLISISANSVPFVSKLLVGLKSFALGGHWLYYFGLYGIIAGSLFYIFLKIGDKVKYSLFLLTEVGFWRGFKLSFFMLWNIIKAAIKGALNVGAYIRDEILDYVRDNSSMFNYLIRKHDAEDPSEPSEITEALEEA